MIFEGDQADAAGNKGFSVMTVEDHHFSFWVEVNVWVRKE